MPTAQTAFVLRTVVAPLAVGVLTLGLLATLFLAPAPPAYAGGAGGDGAEIPAGQRVFLAQKCNTCHAVEPLGIEARTKSAALRGPDLAGVSARHPDDDAGVFAAYLQGRETLGGKRHKQRFKGTDEELQAVVAWLLTLEASD